MRAVPGWEQAARRIGFQAALGAPVDLDEKAYHALHDGTSSSAALHDDTSSSARGAEDGVFYIERIGRREEHFDDSGIEYYRYGA